MLIFGGMQKLTLLDFPNKTACTVFTHGCNFVCPFCHNSGLVVERVRETLSEQDVLDFLKTRIGILEGVCITGGEPLIQDGLVDFIRKVRELGFCVKLDTNGSVPEILEYVVQEKLVDYVAMDIKNSPELYGITVGIEDLDLSNIERSKNFLINSDVDFEFRTTVVRQFHSQESLEALSEWIVGAKRYYLQSFKDSGDLICSGLSGYDAEEMLRLLDAVKRNIPNAQLRGI